MNKLALVLLGFSLVTGCADPYANTTYASNRVGIWQNVSYGVVTNVRPVVIQDRNHIPVGAIAGAGVGGLLGHKIGGGKGKLIATGVGVLLGGIAGDAVQTQTNKTKAIEIGIMKENQQRIAVVQRNTGDIGIGTRVRLVDAGGRLTVSPAPH